MTDEELRKAYVEGGRGLTDSAHVAGLRAVAKAAADAEVEEALTRAVAQHRAEQCVTFEVLDDVKRERDIAEARAAHWKAMVDREREAHRYRMTDGAEAEMHWALVKKHEGEQAEALAKLRELGGEP